MNVRRTTFDDHELRDWWTAAYASGALRVNTFFQSWNWNVSWWDSFGAGDSTRELFLLKGERGGAIVFAAPLFVQRTRVATVTVWERLLWIADELSPYPDLITTSTENDVIWNAIVDFVERARPRAWLQLSDVYPWSTLADAIPPRARVEKLEGCSCLRLEFPRGGNCAVEQLVRPQFRRTFAKAVREPDPERLSQLMELNLQRFGRSSFFADPVNLRFFNAMAASEAGEAMLAVLEVDGVPRHLIYGYYHADVFCPVGRGGRLSAVQL